MGPDGQKMSKSKGNVINPDDFVNQYGADAVRLYLAFIGPYNEPGSYPWNLDGVAAMRKFLDRIMRLITRSINEYAVPISVEQAVARASVKVAKDGDRFKFNTGVAALMILVNELEACTIVPASALAQLAVMLAPFAPHLAEHVWGILGKEGSVHTQSWPVATPIASIEREVVVQVNGKRRGSMTLTLDASENEAVVAAREILSVSKALSGNEPKRVIYVPGKVINIVV
jgi:leucyl-tRNA synthetase